MIDHLDALLHRLFRTRVAGLVDDVQVRFQPPDDDWRAFVGALGDRALLNVYLVELRENRKLRSNDFVRTIEAGVAYDRPAPPRVDCHYLITAWSPAAVTPAIEPAVDEHQLLADAARVLFETPSLVPRDLYFPNSLPVGFPPELSEAELPVQVLPVEGFPKYAEFWGTMGQVHPWRPAIYLVVTVPLLAPKYRAGPLVTTQRTDTFVVGQRETAETRLVIGGTVRRGAAPVAGAWVQIEGAGAPTRQTRTDELGRFRFDLTATGPYELTARSIHHGEVTRPATVPAPTAESYDLTYPP